MALFAKTTAETVKFVSEQDSACTVKEVPIDPKDPSKGTRKSKTWDEKEASIFEIRPLDVFLMAYLYDNNASMSRGVSDDEMGERLDIQSLVNKTNIEAVRFGLVSLPDNFRTKDGKAVPFATKEIAVNGRKYAAVQDSVLKSLGLHLVTEMAATIKELSEVSGEDAKNSAEA